jgi:hypothetical protein
VRSIKLPSWIEALVGLAPVPVPPHVFALGPDRLDYARFERASRRLELRELRSLPLAPTTFQHGLLGGPLTEPAAFQGQLKSLVQGISVPVKAASLVLPDAWLRVVFAESEALPKVAASRAEVLRWKLKRLVPFRVDELRIEAVEVEPLADQSEPRRLMTAFAVEVLLSQLEEAFTAAGVWLGQITNASLALLSAVDDGRAGLTALTLAEPEGYSLAFARAGEPVLHRFKALGSAMPRAARGSLVNRDLRLTRNFLEQQFPGVPLERALVAAPASLAPDWLDWLSHGLGCPAEVIGEEHLPLAPEASAASREALTATGLFGSWAELAPLVGAASQEVA